MAKSPDTIGEIQIYLETIIQKQNEMGKTNEKRFDEIVDHLKYTNGKVMANTKFRLTNSEKFQSVVTNTDFIKKTQGIISLLKWVGLANIAGFIYLIAEHFSK